ncbi:Muskelin N-terminus-domain-containing protein [Pisolithus microcarpus]|nr:Muskelin N-terminus-domain-containing protein [Pisolithus microcarpus]
MTSGISASSSSTRLPTEVVSYTIASCSEHSGNYVADNIKVDRPLDQASRWSGAQQAPSMKQWILLRLDTLAVVKSITFGKFHKKHPCNMKEFKVYVGLHPDHMVQVLHTCLKDDAVPESFAIPETNKTGLRFPSRFVKILPLSAHGQSFHVSIWHVSVTGIVEPAYVEAVRARYDEYRETVIARHILKHLRQRRMLMPYMSILARTRLELEHPLVTALHSSLVLQGDFPSAELVLSQMASANLFDDYLRSCQPRARWTRLHGANADGDAPGPRGGHAMALDASRGVIYLLGGWDGRKSLDDLWAYNIGAERWEILCRSTAKEKNGPGPRSCHKMVCDSKTGCLYVLGRLGDDIGKISSSRSPSEEGREQARTQTGDRNPNDQQGMSFCSEFYRYHTRGLDGGKWDLLSFDTATSGGPQLIFDHQMVMDSETQTIYVSGGRVVNGDWDSPKYSAFYSYDVRSSKWKLLQPISASGPSSVQSPISQRSGHSMVFDPLTHTLFVFAGQKDERYLSDMCAYDTESNTVTELFSNFSSVGGPDACFTQRAVIDPTLKEIYVFCGLSRSQQTEALTVLKADAPNWVYRYTYPNIPGTWTQILPEPLRKDIDHSKTDTESMLNYGEGEYGAEWDDDIPRPRYAHQVVYDEKTGKAFLHGGNAGETKDEENEHGDPSGDGQDTGIRSRGESGEGPREPEGIAFSSAGYRRSLAFRDGGMEGSENRNDEDVEHRSWTRMRELRLDDFWSMTLIRAGPEEVVRRAVYHIRRQRFREMCEDQPPLTALRYLQTEVADVVDHSDSEEADIFRSLLSHLLVVAPLGIATPTSSGGISAHHDQGSGICGDDTEEEVSEGQDWQRKVARLEDVPPKKRTRSQSPGEEELVWTSMIEGNDGGRTGGEVEGYGFEPSAGSCHPWSETTSRSIEPTPLSIAKMTRSGGQKRSHAVLLLDEDPLEVSSSGSDSVHDGSKTRAKPLSADRFRQRTEVFEGLLELVETGAKQPEGSLLDLVDSEGGL